MTPTAGVQTKDESSKCDPGQTPPRAPPDPDSPDSRHDPPGKRLLLSKEAKPFSRVWFSSLDPAHL